MFNTSVGKQFCISIWDRVYEEAKRSRCFGW
jgi:hypothetical protein